MIILFNETTNHMKRLFFIFAIVLVFLSCTQPVKNTVDNVKVDSTALVVDSTTTDSLTK
mgnify:FL=1